MDSWRGQPTLFVSFQKQSGLGRMGDTFVVLNQPICQGAAERNYVNPLVQEIGGSLVNKRIRVGLRMVRFVRLSILPNDTMFFQRPDRIPLRETAAKLLDAHAIENFFETI